jgi:transcriptional regulator with XRE-family HTH domain
VRKRRDMTLAQVAEYTGLSISFLSDLERGKTDPSLSSLRKIAGCYGVPVAYLLEERWNHMDEEEQEPDFTHPPHELPSLYPKALLLLCDTCGYWEIVQDVREGRKWRSDRTLPCQCQVCYGESKGTVDVVYDDRGLRLLPEEEDEYDTEK